MRCRNPLNRIETANPCMRVIAERAVKHDGEQGQVVEDLRNYFVDPPNGATRCEFSCVYFTINQTPVISRPMPASRVTSKGRIAAPSMPK